MSETIEYRLLSVGEVIREGDEYFEPQDAAWRAVLWAGLMVDDDDRPIRRRTTLPSNPQDCDASRILDSLRDDLQALAEMWTPSMQAHDLRAVIRRHFKE